MMNFKLSNLMKYFLNVFLFLLAFPVLENNVLAMTDFQIREFCQRQKNKSTCIKNLQFKRFNLLQGNRIEIPVIPFRNN